MIDDLLVTLILAPALLVQGIYTKKVTPKLPEPEGGRSGSVGSGDSLRLLILGDSAAAGVGVTRQEHALSGQLVSRLSRQYSVNWRLEAQSGLDTQDIIQKLEEMDAFETDLVVISLGVNDVISRITRKKWARLQARLNELLLNKFAAKHILFTSIPPLHIFPALPQPLRWYLGRRAKRFNTFLSRQSLSLKSLAFIEIKFPMDKGFFAHDGFHPSAKAYDIWADSLAEKILNNSEPDKTPFSAIVKM